MWYSEEGTRKRLADFERRARMAKPTKLARWLEDLRASLRAWEAMAAPHERVVDNRAETISEIRAKIDVVEKIMAHPG